MPTYEYKCSLCGHQMEAFQSITAKALRKCPDCGRNSLKRLIGTGAGIIFKGSGFWQTDYRSEGYKKAAEADKKSAEPAKSETKTESKADTKAESKSDSKPAEKHKHEKKSKKKD